MSELGDGPVVFQKADAEPGVVGSHGRRRAEILRDLRCSCWHLVHHSALENSRNNITPHKDPATTLGTERIYEDKDGKEEKARSSILHM